jgi:predicted ferric reductase
MEEKVPITENLINSSRSKSTKKKYTPYENQSHETVLFRFLPDFIFRLRWAIISFTHKKLFRLFGLDFTIGGVLFFILAFGSIPTVEYLIWNKQFVPGASTGWVNIFCLCMTITFSTRNSIWAFLVGLSVERAMFWHKFFALGLIGFASIHAYSHFKAFDITNKGQLLWTSIITTGILAIWFIRKRFFFFFYLFHVLMVGVILFNLYRHAPKYIILCTSFWAVDIFLRSIFSIYCMFKGTSFNLKTSRSGDIIELSSKNPIISHLPGQFFFLTIPKVSVIEPHPFTAASLPNENLTFYIRGLGDWTKKLGKLATTQNEVSVIVNGPYGIPTVNIEDSGAKHFVLVAGGIGVTFLKPHLENLIDQANRGRKLRSVTFLWSIRNSDILELIQFSEQVKELIKHHSIKHESTSSSQKSTDSKPNTFSLNFHIFSKADIEESVKVDPMVKKAVVRESLDLDRFFGKITEEGKIKKNSLKVLCCGPNKLISHCFDLCKAHGYDLHSEYFEF